MLEQLYFKTPAVFNSLTKKMHRELTHENAPVIFKDCPLNSFRELFSIICGFNSKHELEQMHAKNPNQKANFKATSQEVFTDRIRVALKKDLRFLRSAPIKKMVRTLSKKDLAFLTLAIMSVFRGKKIDEQNLFVCKIVLPSFFNLSMRDQQSLISAIEYSIADQIAGSVNYSPNYSNATPVFLDEFHIEHMIATPSCENEYSPGMNVFSEMNFNSEGTAYQPCLKTVTLAFFVESEEVDRNLLLEEYDTDPLVDIVKACLLKYVHDDAWFSVIYSEVGDIGFLVSTDNIYVDNDNFMLECINNQSNDPKKIKSFPLNFYTSEKGMVLFNDKEVTFILPSFDEIDLGSFEYERPTLFDIGYANLDKFAGNLPRRILSNNDVYQDFKLDPRKDELDFIAITKAIIPLLNKSDINKHSHYEGQVISYPRHECEEFQISNDLFNINAEEDTFSDRQRKITDTLRDGQFYLEAISPLLEEWGCLDIVITDVISPYGGTPRFIIAEVYAEEERLFSESFSLLYGNGYNEVIERLEALKGDGFGLLYNEYEYSWYGREFNNHRVYAGLPPEDVDRSNRCVIRLSVGQDGLLPRSKVDYLALADTVKKVLLRYAPSDIVDIDLMPVKDLFGFCGTSMEHYKAVLNETESDIIWDQKSFWQEEILGEHNDGDRGLYHVFFVLNEKKSIVRDIRCGLGGLELSKILNKGSLSTREGGEIDRGNFGPLVDELESQLFLTGKENDLILTMRYLSEIEEMSKNDE